VVRRDAPTVELFVPSSAEIRSTVNVMATASQQFGRFVEFGWDFDTAAVAQWDTVFTTLRSVAYSYSDPGTYHPRFYVKDDDGNVTIGSTTITVVKPVHLPQIVTWRASDTTATVGDSLGFSMSLFTDPVGVLDVKRFRWNLDGDTLWERDLPANVPAGRRFASAGDYRVKLRIDDSMDGFDVESLTVHILQGEPTANAGNDRTVGIGVAIAFNGIAADSNRSGAWNARDGLLLEYKWDYQGDGVWEDSSATNAGFAYTYPDLGASVPYEARFCATDDDANTTCDTVRITVANRPPLLTVVASKTAPTVAQTIVLTPTFVDPDGNQIDSLWWDLDGDGSFETALTASATPRDSFPAPAGGTYLVRVRGTDRWGGADTAQVSLVVPANRAPSIAAISSNRASNGYAVPGTPVVLSVTPALFTDPDGAADLVDSLWWDLDGDGLWEVQRGASDTVVFLGYVAGSPLVRVKGRDRGGEFAYDSLTLRLVGSEANPCVSDSFTDERDGHVYSCAILGGQAWMSQNLNYGVAGSGMNDDAVDQKFCADYLESECTAWGGYYTWPEAMGLPSSCWNAECTATFRGICPTGWHVPSLDDWNALGDWADGQNGGLFDNEGLSLKSTTGWLGGETGLDSYGFHGLPSGAIDIGSQDHLGLGAIGEWWSSTPAEGAVWMAMEIRLDTLSQSLFSARNSRASNPLPLRCLKDQ
jgi:uncharacterized protein (TIGR02145 family)